MEPRQRLFIYDRKEMGVLVLLGLMVALFAFTLGVHLGKRNNPKTSPVAQTDVAEHGTTPVATASDQVPDRQELNEAAKKAPEAMDESLNRALHDEVAKTGIKMENPKPVELPKDTRSETGGATTPEPDSAHGSHGGPAAKIPTHEEVLEHTRVPEQSEHSEKQSVEGAQHSSTSGGGSGLPALSRAAPEGYSLQIGAFKTLNEIKDRVASLEAAELKPFVRQVDLGKRGKWYRIYLGGFDSKEEADRAAKRYKQRRLIESYIVSNHTE